MAIDEARHVRTLEPARLMKFAQATLERAGLTPGDSAIGADVLVRADMRGVPSHGSRYLLTYVKQMQSGRIDARATPEIVHETKTTAVMEGHAGMGHVIAVKAMKYALEKAESSEIAVVVVRNSNHFGAAGHFALMAAEADHIGLVFTNAPPYMSVTGGVGRIIGTNPIAYGVPHAAFPIVLDVATSAAAGSRVAMHFERGRPIPEGWIMDAKGEPSTDPNDLVAGGGALLPFWPDHKGYGFALLDELLTGALSGGPMASGVLASAKGRLGTVQSAGSVVAEPSGTSHTFIALSVKSFCSVDEYKTRVAQLAAELHGAPKARGVKRIYVPGEIEAEAEAAHRRDGLEFDQITWDALAQAAKEVGLSDMLEATVRSQRKPS